MWPCVISPYTCALHTVILAIYENNTSIYMVTFFNTLKEENISIQASKIYVFQPFKLTNSAKISCPFPEAIQSPIAHILYGAFSRFDEKTCNK